MNQSRYNNHNIKILKSQLKKQCQIGDILLTHWPVEVESNIFNYYAHIHNKEEIEQFLDGKHKCISLEKTNYMPIEISL